MKSFSHSDIHLTYTYWLIIIKVISQRRDRINMKMKNWKTWLGVLFLIALEQIIKIVINHQYINKSIPIIPPLLYFEPMFNRDYSWFNSMLQLGIGKWLHITIVAIMILFIYLFYHYVIYRIGSKKVIHVLFAFIFSGAMCSLIDKIFWNGSLDYIKISEFFTFDLKDVYVNTFIGLLLLLMILKSKVFKQIDEKIRIKDFIKYIFRIKS